MMMTNNKEQELLKRVHKDLTNLRKSWDNLKWSFPDRFSNADIRNHWEFWLTEDILYLIQEDIEGLIKEDGEDK